MPGESRTDGDGREPGNATPDHCAATSCVTPGTAGDRPTRDRHERSPAGEVGVTGGIRVPLMPAGPAAFWRERIASIPAADLQPSSVARAGAADGPHEPAPPAGPGDGPVPARRRRWRSRRRIIAISAVVLLAVLVAADRFVVSAAEDQMAKQIEASVSESLGCDVPPPSVRDVSIGGFPFLTQIAFGDFRDIGLTVEGISTPGPRVSSVEAHLKGIHLPVRKILTNSVGEVPVDTVEATVRLDYADVNTFLAGQPGQVRINPVDGGDQIEVSGTADLPVLGSQEVGGVTTFEVRDNELIMVPSEISLQGSVDFSIPVPGGLGQLLPAIPIPVGGLPFDLTLAEAFTDASGLSLTATAKDVVLPQAEATTRRCPPSDSGGT